MNEFKQRIAIGNECGLEQDPREGGEASEQDGRLLYYSHKGNQELG